MKYLINIILLLIVAFLGYLLYTSIKEPIAFGETKDRRQNVVVDKLREIRTAQEIYRSIKGQFAGSFDSLAYTLKTDSIPFVKIIGDPDDPTNQDKFQKTITYSAAYDSIKALGINLDSLKYVPYADNGATFEIAADTIEYQKTTVGVVEVGTKWKTFMGKYGDKRFSKYDASYDPNKTLKFGDMNTPNISGNWER